MYICVYILFINCVLHMTLNLYSYKRVCLLIILAQWNSFFKNKILYTPKLNLNPNPKFDAKTWSTSLMVGKKEREVREK